MHPLDLAFVFTVQLPIPPSVNQLFSNVRGIGRAKTKAYRDWCDKASAAVSAERYSMGIAHRAAPLFKGAVSVIVEIDRPRADRDLDNCLKPILDALVSSGVIADDKYVSSIAASWSDKTEKPVARVAVYSAGEAPYTAFKPSEPGSVTGHLQFRR